MEIKNIKIKNFKSIESLNIKTNRKINLIVGKNNTGKTTIIQSIYLAFSPKEFVKYYRNEYNLSSLGNLINYSADKSIIEIQTNRIKSKKTIRLEISRTKIEDSIVFIKDQVEDSIKKDKQKIVELDHKLLSKYSKDFTRLFEVKINEIKVLIEQLITERKDEIINSIKDDIIIDREYYPSLETKKLIFDIGRQLYEKIMERTEKVTIKSDLNEMLDILHFPTSLNLNFYNFPELSLHKNKIYNGLLYINAGKINLRQFYNQSETTAMEIQDIIKKTNMLPGLERFTFRNIVFKKDGIREEIPLEVMGDGFKVLIYIISMILTYKDKKIKPVILVEEPEIHMHPGYINEFIKYLIDFSNNNNMQFFITTHSEDLINSFLREDLDDESKNKLKKEFQIIRLTNINNENLVETIDYDGAFDSINTLYLDLRGI